MIPADLSTLGALVAAGFAALASSVGTGAVLRRRLSRDRTEMTKDRIESRFVEQLAEREQAAVHLAHELANREREAQAAIARLEQQNRHQAEDIARLQREFAAFRRLMVRLYPDATRFLPSEAGALTPFLDTVR